MEQLESQLPAAELKLSDDVLDRIDEIVSPVPNRTQEVAGSSPAGLHSDDRLRKAGREALGISGTLALQLDIADVTLSPQSTLPLEPERGRSSS
jgi:hypothetical protein